MKKNYSFIEIERDLSPAFAERRTLLRSMSWWCGLLAPVAGQLVVELVRIGEIYRGGERLFVSCFYFAYS